MNHIVKRRAKSFKNAYEGVVWALREHPNYQIHIILSIFAVFLGIQFRLSNIEWIVIILTITLGIVIETINTAIEATLDVIDTKWRQDIKIAKDVSSAAMFMYSVGAVIIAGIVFLPKIIY